MEVVIRWKLNDMIENDAQKLFWDSILQLDNFSVFHYLTYFFLFQLSIIIIVCSLHITCSPWVISFHQFYPPVNHHQHLSTWCLLSDKQDFIVFWSKSLGKVLSWRRRWKELKVFPYKNIIQFKIRRHHHHVIIFMCVLLITALLVLSSNQHIDTVFIKWHLLSNSLVSELRFHFDKYVVSAKKALLNLIMLVGW